MTVKETANVPLNHVWRVNVAFVLGSLKAKDKMNPQTTARANLVKTLFTFIVSQGGGH